MKKLLLLFCLSWPAFAQLDAPIHFVSSNPTGSCPIGIANTYNTTTGDFYGCKGGTWAVVAASGGGTVASVFGRTGTVTATTGDYTAAQVTNAADTTASYTNPGFINTLAASKLTGFTVNNDTNVTGSFSAGALTLGWTGTLAKTRMLSTVFYDDQSNTITTGTQNFTGAAHTAVIITVANVAALPSTGCVVGELAYVVSGPTLGQNVYENSGSGSCIWTQQTGGGGGGGISAFYQLTDFQLIKSNSTLWTMNGAASSSTPVHGLVGDTSYLFNAPATIAVSGTSSTGSVYWCLLSGGTLSIYSNLAATFTGTGVSVNVGTACPANSRTLWIATMTANVIDTMTEAMDMRGAQMVAPVTSAGSFMTCSTASNIRTCGIDVTLLTGNGSKLGTSTGSLTSGDYVKIDANGNFIDGGGGTTGITPGTCIQGSGTVTTVSVDNSGTVTTCPPTQSQIQAGKPTKLTTTSSSGTVYTATGAPTYTAYTQDAQFMWDVGGTACTGGTTTTLNVDGLGAKTIFEADGSTNPVSADCTAHRIVLLSYDSSGNFRIIGGGAVGGSSGCPTCLAPFTRNTIYEFDDFFPANFYGFGKLGWQQILVQGSGSAGPSIGNATYSTHPGLVVVATGSTTSDQTNLVLNGHNSGDLNWLSLGSGAGYTSWEVQFTILTDDNCNCVTSLAMQMGFAGTSAYRSGNAIGIRYDTTVQTCNSGTNSTTNWMFETISGGTSTCTDMGVAVAAAQWYTFDITSSSLGTVIAKVSTNGGAFSSPITISTNVPTGTMWPNFLDVTRTAGAHRFYIDYWAMQINGLTR